MVCCCAPDKKERIVNKDANGKKEIRNRHGVNKAQMGHFAKAGVSGKRFVKEFKFENAALEGPNAVAISKTDATAPARILAKFAKDAKALEIKAGIVEGTYYDAAGMDAVSKIPSRDELLGKLLGSIQSPIANLARVLNQIAEKGGAANCEAAPAEEAPAAE